MTPEVKLDAKEVRDALGDLPRIAAQEGLTPPDFSRIVIPASHVKALHLDATVVVGIRGVGKSFWTAVLASTPHRKFVVGQMARLPELRNVQVVVGHAEATYLPDFPNKAELKRHLTEGRDPKHVWLAVLLRHAWAMAEPGAVVPPAVELLEQEVLSDPVAAERRLWAFERQIAASGRCLLVLFDALDRLADDWRDTRQLVKAALQWGLLCRASSALRLKYFMRPDLEEDPEVWAFPDSSKLRQGRLDLSWRAADLYSVVLQHLINSKTAGPAFRASLATASGVTWQAQDGAYPLPDAFRRDGPALKRLIESITGQWMGASKKRGFCYTWIPLHLADARGNGTPRSILLAMRTAAAWTHDNEPLHTLPLHHLGIQHGVADASVTRLAEIGEDYPWIKPALEAVNGIVVPCELVIFEDRWSKPATRNEIESIVSGRLPPRRFSSDPIRAGRPEALVDDLIDLAVLYRTEDGRLNMPDIFRVGAKIKRKGGVRPPQR